MLELVQLQPNQSILLYALFCNIFYVISFQSLGNTFIKKINKYKHHGLWSSAAQAVTKYLESFTAGKSSLSAEDQSC